MESAVRRAGAPALRLALLAVAMLAVAGLVSGCASPASEASHSVTFDSSSEKAVVVLGTTNHRAPSAPEDGLLDRPNSLATHWQEYDPHTMRLVPGGALMMSLRGHNAWEKTTVRDDIVHVLEVKPGDYALIGVTNTRTVTSFFPLHDENGDSSRRTLAPYVHGLEMRGKVDPKKHFHFSVEPGQIVYIGHFNFLHPGGGNHRIVDVVYSLNVAAARAALKDYPGITGEMITLNLALPTEQAAR